MLLGDTYYFHVMTNNQYIAENQNVNFSFDKYVIVFEYVTELLL